MCTHGIGNWISVIVCCVPLVNSVRLRLRLRVRSRIVFDRLPRLIHAAFVCGTISPPFDVGLNGVPVHYTRVSPTLPLLSPPAHS